MHPNFEDYWQWYVTAWVLYALSGMLFAWALFWDRSQRRGVTQYRCPKCWYDLRGIKDAITENTCCSECGRSIRRHRDLLHTRRNKRWSVVALVLLLFGFYCFKKPISHDNWIPFFPTSLLIVLPLPEGSELDNVTFLTPYNVKSPLWASLSSRLHGGELWNWQERLLKSRIVRHYTRSNRMGISELERQTARRVISSTIEIENKPYTIHQLIEQIQEDLGIAIQADWESLAQSGYFGGDESFNPPPATYLLSDLLDEFRLADWHSHIFLWRIENDLIHLAYDSDYLAANRVVRYGIENDTNDYSIDSALWLILNHVTPDEWYDLGGGFSSYIFLDNELLILTSVRNHFLIEQLLKARNDPPGWMLPDSTIESLEKAQPSTIVQRTLSIRNLADSEAEVEKIIVMIEETIDPLTWDIMGGELGDIDILPDKLFIKTTIINHRAIEQLLHDLRAKIEAGLSLEQAIDDLEKETAGKPDG